MIQQAQHFYEFGPFRLDPVRRLLLRDGQPVTLTAKAFDILLALIENRERVVEKSELLDWVWPDTIVEEGNLPLNVHALRKALGERPGEHRYIVTHPGRGYRFVASVSEVRDNSPALLIAERTRSSVVIEEVNGQEALDTSVENARRRAVKWWRKPTPLRPALVACAVIVGLALAAFYLWTTSSPKPSGDVAPIKSIAVLPFKPLVAGSRDELLEMGMADTRPERAPGCEQGAAMSCLRWGWPTPSSRD